MNKTLLDNLQATLGPLIENSPLKDMEQNVRALLTQASPPKQDSQPDTAP